jgi:hypothetical protein
VERRGCLAVLDRMERSGPGPNPKQTSPLAAGKSHSCGPHFATFGWSNTSLSRVKVLTTKTCQPNFLPQRRPRCTVGFASA